MVFLKLSCITYLAALPPLPPPAVVKCSIELGNYIHLSNYVQKAEATPEGQVRARRGAMQDAPRRGACLRRARAPPTSPIHPSNRPPIPACCVCLPSG